MTTKVGGSTEPGLTLPRRQPIPVTASHNPVAPINASAAQS